MVAELITAGVQGQNPPSTARVQIETHFKPEKQFKGTIASFHYFRNSLRKKKHPVWPLLNLGRQRSQILSVTLSSIFTSKFSQVAIT